MNHNETDRIIKVEVRLDNLEVVVKEVRVDIKKVLENELPHIRQEIQANKYKIAAMTGAAAFVGAKLVDWVLK